MQLPPSLPPEVVPLEQWLDRRGDFSEKEHVLNRVKRILDMSTPVKFDLLKGFLTYYGIQKADILMEVNQLIFEKAVLEPAFCNMYAVLFSDLHQELPPLAFDETDGKMITVKRLLLRNCQETFEGADKLSEEVRRMTGPDQESERREKERIVKFRALGNICLIGELLHQKMITEKIVHHIVQELLGPDKKSCPAEENIEALCQLFHAIWKQPDESPELQHMNNLYFSRLKELSTNPDLAPRLRMMVRDVFFLGANKFEGERGPSSTLTTAEVPQLVRRGNLLQEERFLRRVKRILNKSTPDKLDVVKQYIIYSGINTADILMELVKMIYEKAILEPACCHVYALLFSDLHKELHPLSSEEPGRKMITVRRILLNCCQRTYEGADKLREEVRQMFASDQEIVRSEKERMVSLRIMGNIRLIGELLNHKMIAENIVQSIIQELLQCDNKVCSAEEKAEAICHLINALLKHRPESKLIHDSYSSRLKELMNDYELPLHLKLMVRDVLIHVQIMWYPGMKR